MKIKIPMYLMELIVPEMMYYNRLPRKTKKKLKKVAEKILFTIVLDRVESVIKEHEIKQ